MRRSFFVLIFILAGLPIMASPQTGPKTPPSKSAKKAPADRRLSLDQIRKLLSIKTPDAVIAQEIQSRGISEDYNHKAINELQRQGAGPETVTALERAIPFATLTIKTEANATVRVDGGSPVQTGTDGMGTLQIEPGQHEISIDKRNFLSGKRIIEAKGRENSSVEIPLDWAVGFLTIIPDVPGAQIQVNGVRHGTRVDRLEQPIGSASVVVLADLRKTYSQTVKIEGGKENTLRISLEPDPAALNSMGTQIHQLFATRAYGTVIAQARRYLDAGGSDKTALADIAVSYFQQMNYPAFRAASQQALTAGGILHFSVLHHHRGFGNFTFHRAELQVSATSIRFEPLEQCNYPAFQVASNQVKVGNNLEREPESASNTHRWAVHLEVPNPSNPKKTASINLATQNDTMENLQQLREFLTTVTH